ncbi:hypothetical protein ON010_g3463 [Phytophthora cinnamomi]|nr:hypothetical protein ON010_g3463 [Phytophthora cinnamomi]
MLRTVPASPAGPAAGGGDTSLDVKATCNSCEHVHGRKRRGVRHRPIGPIDAEEQSGLARAAQTRHGQIRRLPVEDAGTQAVGQRIQDVHDSAHPLALARGVHRVRSTERDRRALRGPVCLGDVDRLVVRVGDLRQRRRERGDRGRGVVERVERKPEDVYVAGGHCAGGEQTLEEGRDGRVLPPVVQVDHDLRLGRAGGHSVVHALAGRLPQRGEVGVVARGDLARRPHEPVSDLIAQRHDVEGHAAGSEGLQRRRHIGPDAGGQRRHRRSVKGRRRSLFGGVRPRVGEVQVQVDLVARLGESLGQSQRVAQVVVAGRPKTAVQRFVHAAATENRLDSRGRAGGGDPFSALGRLHESDRGEIVALSQRFSGWGEDAGEQRSGEEHRRLEEHGAGTSDA